MSLHAAIGMDAEKEIGWDGMEEEHCYEPSVMK